MKRYTRPAVIVIAVMLLLMVSNPGFDRHKEKIAEKLHEREGLIAAAFGALKNELGYLRYKDYLLCSVTVEKNQQRRVVSFGLLGKVFVFTGE